MAQSTRWCFTINNYTEDEYHTTFNTQCRYIIIGKEVGNSNTRHLQGYVVFEKNKRLAAVKKLFPRAHLEIARGSNRAAADYCKKEGSFEERGILPLDPKENGDRGREVEMERWKRAREASAEGCFEDVPSDIYVRYYRTLKEIRKDNMTKPPDADDVTGVWIYGPAGVGKSRKARVDYPDAYLKMQNKWWDGYQGEEFVILDDFDSKELGHHLKIWFDRYSFLAETKGGAMHIRPKKFIVTSNYSPDDPKFDWDDEMRAAIKRRFKIIHMVDTLGGIKLTKN